VPDHLGRKAVGVNVNVTMPGGSWTFAPGDKVMQIENDYDKEVYNGDIGSSKGE
jgi:ATP-dependent exoDNAse (exonuclease V) alpha subunit